MNLFFSPKQNTTTVHKEKNILGDKKKISAHVGTWVSIPWTAKGVASHGLLVYSHHKIRTMKIHAGKKKKKQYQSKERNLI